MARTGIKLARKLRMSKTEIALAVALGAAAGLFVFSRTETGAAVIGDTVEKVVSTVRGIRNNNPGNIRRSGEAWQGLSPTQTDSAFFQFQSMAYGVRAMVKILRNYSTRYGLNTVQGIINRWAPPSENNTRAYVQSVADSLGVGANDALDLYDVSTVAGLVRAIVNHENGRIPALLVTDADIRQGIELA